MPSAYKFIDQIVTTTSPEGKTLGSRQRRLGFRAWLMTLGLWGPTLKAVTQFGSEDWPVLRGQINRLINIEVKRLLILRGQGNRSAHIEARLRSNLRKVLQEAIPVAARALTSEQFSNGLVLATSLAEREISPLHTLQSGLPAAAQVLTLEQFAAGLTLATRLAERGIYPSSILQSGLSAAAKALTPEQFMASLALATRLAERGIDPFHTLHSILPAVAQALTPEQFMAGLTLATRLAEQRIDPRYTLEFALLAAAKALTPEQFSEGLVLAARLAERKIDPYSTLKSALPAAVQALTPEQFSEGLVLATCLAERGIDPFPTLQSILPTTAKASPTLAAFQANLRALEGLITRLAEGKSNQYDTLPSVLPVVAQALTPEQFTASLVVAIRLTEQGISPFHTLQFGLPAVAQALTPEQFTASLVVATRLAEQGMDPSTSPGLVKLTRQAIALKQEYEDFEPVWHPESTHREIDLKYEPNWEYIEVVDHPAQVELRPVGRRISALTLEPTEATRLRTLLTQRSWLWQFHADCVEQERALERITNLQVFLPTIVDQLFRHGVLEPAVRLTSVYLLGSYPWVPRPADINLFLVANGEREVTFFTTEALIAREVQKPELPVGMTVEIVGYETLRQASRREPVPNAKRLVLCYTLLYGSVLLAGHDLFETTPMGREAFGVLRKGLLEDRKRADWPELGGDRAKMMARQAWRQCEANALAWFIGLVGPSTDFLHLFEPTKAQEELDLLTSLLTEGFQAVAKDPGPAGLETFQTRFGINFFEVRGLLKAISKGFPRFGFERIRQKSARMILAAGPTTLEVETLPIPPHPAIPDLPALPPSSQSTLLLTETFSDFTRAPDAVRRPDEPPEGDHK